MANATSIRRTGKREVVRAYIRTLIREENLQPGDKILSQNELAQELEVTPLTAHRALTDLCAEGLLYRIRGHGTFVGTRPVTASERINMAFVLQEERMDSPERNPFAWQYVSNIMRNFMDVLGNRGSFTSLAIAPTLPVHDAMKSLAPHDVICFLVGTGHDALMHALADDGRAVALLLGGTEKGILSVNEDRRQSVSNGIVYLSGLGYRNIAYMGISGDIHEGYCKGLEISGLKEKESRVQILPVFSGADTLEQLLAANPRKGSIDVIFTDTDIRALKVIDLLRQKGMQVPDDIAVMSCDGLESATAQPPYLTTIRRPYREMIQSVLEYFSTHESAPKEGKTNVFIGEILQGKTCVQKTR